MNHELNLSDLHNPQKVVGIMIKNGDYFEEAPNQQWPERPGSWELWQKLDDGRLIRVQRWLKKSVIATYVAKTKTEKTA